MTPEEIGALTLADLEAMAARFGAAVKTIREAQALLGGRHNLEHGAPAENPPPAQPAPPVLRPNEMAERARLMRQFAPVEVEAEMLRP